VRDGVNANLPELLDVGVPMVLDLVVRPPGKPRRDLGPPPKTSDAVSLGGRRQWPAGCIRHIDECCTNEPVAELLMEVDDQRLFLRGEESPLEVGPRVVGPPQPVALPAPE
jgi:hypothetical protein